MPEPHDQPAIRTTRQTIEAQLMAGTYYTALDDITKKEEDRG